VSSSLSHLWTTARAKFDLLPDRQALRVVVALWILVGVIVFTIVAIDPVGRSATKEYQDASTRWWPGQESLYKGKNKYLYLPQAAMIYTPFNILPQRVGEPLWRMVCLGTLAFAIWTAARHLAPGHAGKIFLLATVLTLPSALASARNGQVNMPLAGLYLLTAIAIARQRWHLSAIILALTLALKPISIVPILLCGVLFPRLILPLILWLAIMFAAAFLHHDPQFVAGQYQAFFQKLTGSAAKPTGHSWCDFAGMLRTFGLALPDNVMFVIRAAAAVATLGICFLALRIKDLLRRSLVVMFFAVIYLMLFNPRTETNSYIILGIFVGLAGAYEALIRRNNAATVLWILLALALGTENFGWPIFPLTNLWLKALVTLALGLWLAFRVVRTPRGESPVFIPLESSRA